MERKNRLANCQENQRILLLVLTSESSPSPGYYPDPVMQELLVLVFVLALVFALALVLFVTNIS